MERIKQALATVAGKKYLNRVPRVRILSYCQNPHAFSGSGWKPDRNSLPWQPKWTRN